jgi:hypothetical protein
MESEPETGMNLVKGAIFKLEVGQDASCAIGHTVLLPHPCGPVTNSELFCPLTTVFVIAALMTSAACCRAGRMVIWDEQSPKLLRYTRRITPRAGLHTFDGMLHSLACSVSAACLDGSLHLVWMGASRACTCASGNAFVSRDIQTHYTHFKP